MGREDDLTDILNQRDREFIASVVRYGYLDRFKRELSVLVNRLGFVVQALS